jgi:hypothetical protein
MRLVMVNTKALRDTNLCAYASVCASPLEGGLIEEGVERIAKIRSMILKC